MDLLDRLLDHDRWATLQLLDLTRDLDAAQLDQEFDIGHRTLRATWIHLIFNIDAWTRQMKGLPERRPDRDITLDAWYEATRDEFASFARHIRDEQRFDDTFGESPEEQLTYGAAILHVLLHNEGHRTEILHILQRLGNDNLPEIDHALWDFARRGLLRDD